MEINRALSSLQSKPWVKQGETALNKLVDVTLAGDSTFKKTLRNTLYGTWLGHPLHPVLSDVPIGAWTAAATFDLLEMATGREELGPASDIAVGLGLAAAVPTALSGINDWQYVSGSPRRKGVVHAVFNTAATLFYGASLVARGAGARGPGRLLAILGYSSLMAGAYVGGDLVFGHRVGTDHSDQGSLPRAFTPVLPADELADGQMKRVEYKGMPILLARCDGEVHAIGNTCSHVGGPLNEGKLVDCSVICPWHGSQFSLKDGHVLNGPASFPQPVLESRIHNGVIEIRRATT